MSFKFTETEENFLFNFTESTSSSVPMVEDVKTLAKSFLMHKIGESINKYYFPIFIPPGIIGNILSFLVMVQKQNRSMSMSWYLAALALVDTIALCIGFCTYFAMEHNAFFPPNQFWYCRILMFILFSAFLASTLLILSMTFDSFYSIIRPHKAASFNTVKSAKIIIVCILLILSMTFDRFYSITRPHKAASFNTVKRAKIIIVSIVISSIVYNTSHLYLSSNDGPECLPYGNAMEHSYGEVYYWCSFVVNTGIPFTLLLVMNSFIIHKIRNRSILKNKHTKKQSGGQNQNQNSKMKSSESQMFAILLLVAFAFLILTTPSYFLFLFVMFIDFVNTPRLFAGYYMLYNFAHKMHTTNHGINFLLYVISGQKFRTDLMKLFVRKPKPVETSMSLSTELTST